MYVCMCVCMYVRTYGWPSVVKDRDQLVPTTYTTLLLGLALSMVQYNSLTVTSKWQRLRPRCHQDWPSVVNDSEQLVATP